MTTHILLVDDEELLRRSLAFNLEQAGYRVTTSGTAEDALAIARRDRPQLVLLDIGLPGMDGLDALRYFRQDLAAPVIFVSARHRELDEVLGLELGADDYVTKPFDVTVLLARIKAVLRRTDQGDIAHNYSTITVGDLVVDPAAYTATINGQRIDLSPREFDLLHALALDAGNVVSIDSLLTQVWGAEYLGEPQVVYVHIRWIREKIEDVPEKPRRILTVRGKGYKLVPVRSRA